MENKAVETPGLSEPAVGSALPEPMLVAAEAAPPILPTADAVPISSQKIWSVGTLTYTAGGLCILFIWLLFGDFAIALRDRSVGPVVQLMLKGFSPSNTSMAMLLSMLPTGISMVLSPIVSYRSDRLRSRWGRRIPYLMISTPVAALSMIGLAFCPYIASGLMRVTGGAMSLHAAQLTTFGVFWTLFEIAAVVASAVLGGLIADVVPRAVTGRFYGLFRAVSLIDGMIFGWFILDHAEQHFSLIFCWIAAVFGIGFMLMCFKIREGEYPPVEELPTNDHRAGGFLAACRIYVRECFSSSHYLWIFAAMTVAALAANPINDWALIYAKQINVPLGRWDSAGFGIGSFRLGIGGIQAVTYFCSLVLAYPLGMLVDRFHALRMTIFSLLLYAVSCFLGYFFIQNNATFGAAFFAHVVISGVYFTAPASLAQALLPRSKFAQFSSARLLMTQAVALVVSPSIGRLLDLTGSNYRITYALSGLFSTVAVLLLLQVNRRIGRMGGLKNHEPPEYVPPVRGFEVLDVRPVAAGLVVPA